MQAKACNHAKASWFEEIKTICCVGIKCEMHKGALEKTQLEEVKPDHVPGFNFQIKRNMDLFWQPVKSHQRFLI